MARGYRYSELAYVSPVYLEENLSEYVPHVIVVGERKSPTAPKQVTQHTA